MLENPLQVTSLQNSHPSLPINAVPGPTTAQPTPTLATPPPTVFQTDNVVDDDNDLWNEEYL